MLNDKEKAELRKQISGNTHEIYIVSVDEMDAIIRSSPKGQQPSVKHAWDKLKKSFELGAMYFASASDAATMTKLVNDLGGMGARAYVKNYGGKPHIIIKGYPGLRTILTGTKYGMKNPKIVSLGLGKVAAVNAARSGGILTIVVLSAYRVVDHMLTDEATLSQLVGTLATDVVKVGITTAASIAAATFVAGATTLAVGPILAVIVVGVGVSLLLDIADQHFGITERIIAGIDELGEDVESYLERTKEGMITAASDAVVVIIEHAVTSAKETAIRWAVGQIRRYLDPTPRLN